MNETSFNLRSFVENQVERIASPTHQLLDKFRQTVDSMKQPFIPADPSISSELSFQIISSDSLVESVAAPAPSRPQIEALAARRQSTFRRNVSESNKNEETLLSRPIFHTNPPIDVQMLFEADAVAKKKPLPFDRSRSLIRQSTDTTCTFPIRRPIRRLESIEIPGLNGVKSIRYINDDLGRLDAELYKKPDQQRDSIEHCGQISLTLFYNQAINALIIRIISIDHLPFRDQQGKILPNPFLRINLLPDRRKKFQTQVYKRCQSVELNETFHFTLPYEQLIRRSLLISVYDFCRSSKRICIGTVKIDDFDTIVDLKSNEITWTKNILPDVEVMNMCKLFASFIIQQEEIPVRRKRVTPLLLLSDDARACVRSRRRLSRIFQC